MLVAFTSNGWEDYLFWQQTDLKVAERINQLIKEIMRSPFSGQGKPEPLRGNLKGYWSRRITLEHRLVYRIKSEGDSRIIIIVQTRFHY